MPTFFDSLAASIFTPGPTPTLLLATNLTFGTLLLVLLALLAFTRSIHFLILSVLATALWWSINWFAAEVRLAQAREEGVVVGDRDVDLKDRGSGSGAEDDAAGGDEASIGDVDGEDTEVEGDAKPLRHKPAIASLSSAAAQSAGPSDTSLRLQNFAAAASTGMQPPPQPQDQATRQRQMRSRMAESTGSLSTDSEWEKVEDER